MEELRSTEILDKEIEADARKKAEKILARAEEESTAILADVSRRVDEASKQKELYYAEKLSLFERSIEEALPLEKGRFLVSFYDDSVSKAFNEYFENLGEAKRLALVEKKLRNLPQHLFEKKINAFVFGFNLSDAKKMLEKSLKNLGEVSEVVFEKSGEEAVKGNDFHEGIILSSDDGFVKIRLTIDQILRETKDRCSEELVKTLFGGRLPE
ncbi:V-type ATP synthase subunit E family protein [uncultured Treponema sp.]|uniref:V-type ATP synthase subunit E family protein n=1 Tax=uncultured Treponema sp. TaxID=162155 RepID=UPI0025F453C9|nr:V-type ATP synthase subunit E family protein [uncultured Treponema sp.]